MPQFHTRDSDYIAFSSPSPFPPSPSSTSSLHRCTVIIMSDQLYTLFFLQQQQHQYHHRLTCTTFWSCKIENKVHEREWIASKQKKGKNSKDIGGWKVIRRPTRVLRIRVGTTCIEFAFFPLLVILECTLHSSYGLAGCCKRLIEKSRYYLRRLANNYIPVHNYSIYLLSIFESPTCI